MSENFKKFKELMLTDKEFQQKLKKAAEAYTGEHADEAAFESIIVPVAAEAGISLTMEDLKQSIQELNPDEMSQVSGGGAIGACAEVGVGWGVSLGDEPGDDITCFYIGIGDGCLFYGSESTE